MKRKRTTSFWALSEKDKIKKMEPKIQKFFVQARLDLVQTFDKGTDRKLKEGFRGYLEGEDFLGKRYLTPEQTKGFNIDFILREDQKKPVFLAMEFKKIAKRQDREDIGENNWTKLANLRASLKVWVCFTNKEKKEADEYFRRATNRLRKFLKERGDIKDRKPGPGLGRFIALRVLAHERKYKPTGKVIAWKYSKELYKPRKVRRRKPSRDFFKSV